MKFFILITSLLIFSNITLSASGEPTDTDVAISQIKELNKIDIDAINTAQSLGLTQEEIDEIKALLRSRKVDRLKLIINDAVIKGKILADQVHAAK